MKLLIVSIVAASAALAPSLTAAQTQPQQPARATAPTTAASSDPVICEKEEVTGSRLATRKVCMTRSQWEDARRQDRMNLEKTQTQRGMESSGKGG
jgi:Ni/Co efflux regulator RcnB